MNTLEMLQKLMENPKRKAIMLVDEDGHDVKQFDENTRTVGIEIFGVFKWVNDGEHLDIFANDKRVWKIIEPPKKLKEMSFGEASYYYWQSSDAFSNDFVSVLTGKAWARSKADISKEEFMGLWTVKGIYEEE